MNLTTINTKNIFQKEVVGNVRKAQEDSHCIATFTPNGDVFVVCDGMGGHVGGKMASTIAVNCIIECLKTTKYDSPLLALNKALQFANMQILGYAKDHPELKGMGTTACILLLQGNEAWIAHVGDSRIYLYLGKEKQLHRITKDHSYVQTLVDAGEITDEQAEHHPNKNRILKALGIKPELHPAFSETPILPKNGDVFLICSDGLSGMIDDNTIKHVLSGASSIQQKGERLINLALENGGLDNITVELIQIDSSTHKTSHFKSYNPLSVKRNYTLEKQKIWLKKILAAIIVLAFFFCGWIIYEKYQEKKLDEQIKRIKIEIEQARKAYNDAHENLINAQLKLKEYQSENKVKAIQAQRRVILNAQKVDSIKLSKLVLLEKELKNKNNESDNDRKKSKE